MDGESIEQDMVSVSAVAEAEAANDDEKSQPSYTPPQTPPSHHSGTHPDKQLQLYDTSQLSSAEPPEPELTQPQICSPPRVNGNRNPLSDDLNISFSSSLSTEEDGTGSSSESSDSEDEQLLPSAEIDEPTDAAVDLELDNNANGDEPLAEVIESGPVGESGVEQDLSVLAEEYPGDEGEHDETDTVMQEENVSENNRLEDDGAINANTYELEQFKDTESLGNVNESVLYMNENDQVHNSDSFYKVDETEAVENHHDQVKDIESTNITDERNIETLNQTTDDELLESELEEPVDNNAKILNDSQLDTSFSDNAVELVDTPATPSASKNIEYSDAHNSLNKEASALHSTNEQDGDISNENFALEQTSEVCCELSNEDSPRNLDTAVEECDDILNKKAFEYETDMEENLTSTFETSIDPREDLLWSGRNGDSVKNLEQSSVGRLENGTIADEVDQLADVATEEIPDQHPVTATHSDFHTDPTVSEKSNDDNESQDPSDDDQSEDSESDNDESVGSKSEVDHAQSDDNHGIEDMDLEENLPHLDVDADEQTLSAPPSPRENHLFQPTNVPSMVSSANSSPHNEDVPTPVLEPQEFTDQAMNKTPEHPQLNESSLDNPNEASELPDDTPQRRSSSSTVLPEKSAGLQSLLMSPPQFKNTDEMKYFFKHHLQYSDLGKLFGNVDVSSVMGSGQASDYAQYLGLQPSVKFKCFKCADSTFASLQELKHHQAKCLKQKVVDSNLAPNSPRGSSATGLRSSLNSDNAMDVDMSENNWDKAAAAQTTTALRSVANSSTCQQIDAKIRITRKVYLCSACGTYYENWNLFFHMREVHQKFICLLCLGIFPSAERLVHHLEGKHNARPDVFEHKEQLLTTLKDQCYMMCTVCEHIFSEHDDFTSHSCENYIKACALCGLKFIHKPQCKAGASGKAVARQRRDKQKGKHRQKKLLSAAQKDGSNNDDAALDGESSGLNFSNTLFGASTSSINGIGGYNFELPQSILSNQTPDAPGSSYVVPPMVPEAPLSFLPHKLLQDDKPPEYPTNSSSSSVSSNSYAALATHSASTQPHLPRSTGKIWPPLDNGYTDPQNAVKTHNYNNNNPNQMEPSQSNAPITAAQNPNPMSGKNISLFQDRDSISISEDYLDNRDMEIINSYINEFDSYGQVGHGIGKNVSLTEIEPMQTNKSPSPFSPQMPPPVVEQPPRLVPKLKLNLSKAFQTPIESEESSTETDDEEDDEEDEAVDEEAEDEEEVEVNQAKEQQPFKPATKGYTIPSNTTESSHPTTPHSFAPPLTPPHLSRSIADSDMQIDVERTSDMAASDIHDDDDESANTAHNQPPVINLNDEDEDVNIEDEDKDTSLEVSPVVPIQPPVPFDGIHLADEDTMVTELLLTQPIDRMPILEFLRLCIKATYPICLYCNHARKIAVNGYRLALHMLAQHRFNATVDSITAEELHTVTIVQRIKSHLDDLTGVFFNLDTFNTSDSANNIISPKSFECFQCRFQARHHKDLYLHNRKMHLKTIVVCLMCKANFYSYSELSGHICPGHVNPSENIDVQFRCVLCNLDRIPSAFRLMVHLRKKHGACDICLEFCDDQSRLSSHVCKHKLHHLCYRCGISYRNKADITKHLFWKHGTESQLCKKCLQKKWPHVYHFCVPPSSFVCEVCSTSFRRAVALKVHKRLHTDDHPYPCTEDGCEKKFISRKLLLKHVARHSAMEEPEEQKPIVHTEPSPVVDIKPEEDVKLETTTVDPSKPAEVEEKVIAPKPLIDIIKDLPAPNLSESDSSDESDHEQPSRPASRSLVPAMDSAVPEEEEHQAPVAGIWDNFKSYQANQKQSNILDDREHDPLPPPLLHVSQSDHDYCAMYKRIVPEAKKLIPMIEIKQEPIDEDEVMAVTDSPVTTPKTTQPKLNKSPKKGRSPKKALDKSGSDSSSSDSDSSCSCGSNCSCSSSSDGSSSSSGSSSDTDSSSSEGRLKKKEKIAKTAPVTKQEEAEHVDVVTEDHKPKPNNDPDLIILESDLETEESETDEEFYDEHPQRMANQLLAEKRKQLLLQTCMNPLNNFDIVENSRPSTPSLPPAEEEAKARKQKGKKRKKDRKNAKCVPSLKLNLTSGSVSVVDGAAHAQMLPTSFPILTQPTPTTAQHVNPTVAHNMDANLHRFTSNFPQNNIPANIKNHLKPRLSTGSSCSDADPSLKRSKRRRIPNKFYGYTSDDESTPTGSAITNPMDAFKPQPPPNLTWCKEDLPQTPTVCRTPPIKTIIKLPTGLNSYARSSSLDYSSIDPNSRFKTASPQLEPPPALPARHSQPPIPPIIIRPNRNIQPPLVEPLRVPAVPVHHIVPPTNPGTEPETDSSDSDSSNDGHLQIQQAPTPPIIHHTPQPFQRTPLPPQRILIPATKTPKPRASATRKRAAPRAPHSTPKAKRQAKANLPKTPAIPAQYLPFMMDPQPAVPPPRPSTAHIPISAVANQIRYPIMPPAGCRPARPGESVYCYCRCPYDEVSEMIACDGDDCPIEWFHFECVNIMVPPKGTWYCPQCRPKYPSTDNDMDAT